MRLLRAIALAARWTWRIGFAVLCAIAAAVLAGSIATRDARLGDHLVHGAVALLLVAIGAWTLRGVRRHPPAGRAGDGR